MNDLAEFQCLPAKRRAETKPSCRPASTSDQAAREQDGKNENSLSCMPSCFIAYVLVDMVSGTVKPKWPPPPRLRNAFQFPQAVRGRTEPADAHRMVPL